MSLLRVAYLVATGDWRLATGDRRPATGELSEPGQQQQQQQIAPFRQATRPTKLGPSGSQLSQADRARDFGREQAGIPRCGNARSARASARAGRR